MRACSSARGKAGGTAWRETAEGGGASCGGGGSTGGCGKGARCVGTGIPYSCDDAKDCTAGLVCCGTFTGATPNNIFCSSAGQCTAPKAYFCDPNIPNPCPNGGTCTPAAAPSGYFRCF